jgi:hypothetical protein
MRAANEKILFCVDMHFSQDHFDSVKESLKVFIMSKRIIEPRTRFSFCKLERKACEVGEFVQDAVRLVDEKLESTSKLSSECDLNSLDDACHPHMKSLAPDEILRIILIFRRSSAPRPLKLSSPLRREDCIIDIVYVHDPLRNEDHLNELQCIFDILTDMSNPHHHSRCLQCVALVPTQFSMLMSMLLENSKRRL